MEIMVRTKQKDGVKRDVWIEKPPEGKGFFIVYVDQQLLERVRKLYPNGYWETELSAAVERCIKDFYLTRPVDALATPASLIRGPR